MRSTFIIISLIIAFSFNSQARATDRILEGAYNEIRSETKYNAGMLEKYFAPTYKNGKNTEKAVYPGGDVIPGEGICSDLVVRALRNAGIDLQKQVHLDILSDRTSYRVKVPDKYIDHRRVWILKTYFKRNWKRFPTKLNNPDDWHPGDIVIWDIGSRIHFHIGIIGKKKRGDGFPYVIHNMGYVPFIFAGKTIEQDVIEGPKLLGTPVRKWKVIGHYRVQ
ncbi:MAG: DUF1287 domain-containing protein [Holophagae bacterium]|nr:DUF1287 domain-containing protein [Holophagae bacterium]